MAVTIKVNDLLTLSALFLADRASSLQIVHKEHVVHLWLSVHCGTSAILDTSFELLAEEGIEVLWLSVSKLSCQILYNRYEFGNKNCEKNEKNT